MLLDLFQEPQEITAKLEKLIKIAKNPPQKLRNIKKSKWTKFTMLNV